MSDDSLVERIRRRAYQLWLDEGCPAGRDRIHWLRAEAEFREILQAQSCAARVAAPHGDSARIRRQAPLRRTRDHARQAEARLNG